MAPDVPLGPGGRRYTIVSCSIEPWDTPWLLHQPLMSVFSRAHKVLYVINEPTLDEVIAGVKQGKLPPSGLTEPHPGIHELRTSNLFPRIYRSKRVDDLSLAMRAGEIRGTIRKIGGENPVLYMWQPRFRELIGKVGEVTSVFHSHDYYPGFYPEGSRHRAEMEVAYDDAIRKSDIVITCSQALQDDAVEARGSSDGVHLIENGVFFDTLRGGLGKIAPTEFEGLPRPIVAYIGRINKTVNFRALTDIARQRPNWSVVVMGPRTGWSEQKEGEYQELSALKNFRYVEGRPASEIGAYFDAIDVGLISYEDDGIKDFRFPLKMVEYFAFGKPTVSVTLSSIKRFEPLVRMVKSDSEWVSAIEDALESDSAERRDARIATARGMDWSEKAVQILNLINDRVARGPRR